MPKAGRPPEDPDNPRVIRVQVVIGVQDNTDIRADLGETESVSGWIYDAIKQKLAHAHSKKKRKK